MVSKVAEPGSRTAGIGATRYHRASDHEETAWPT